MNKKAPRPCKIKDCPHQAYARGVCFNHYIQAWRVKDSYGNVDKSLAALIERRNAPAALPNAPQEQEKS